MYSFKIASRSSPLALIQVEEIIQSLKDHGINVNYELIKFETAGDKDRSTPLTASPDNFFTDSIDRALLNNTADIAIHSAKDLPQNISEGLEIFALTACLDNKDAWVGRVHWSDLPVQAKVGTSSVLRQQQVLQLRPDLKIVNIRGSIGERLELIKKGEVDGVIVAVCALKRLKLEREIKDIFTWEGTPLQGQLAVVGRCGDQKLKSLFSVIDIKGDSPQNGDRAKVFLHCGTHPELCDHLGQIVHWPMIAIKPVPFDEAAAKDLLQAFGSADIMMFTSRYAVEHFLSTLLSVDPSVDFKQKTFAVIGRQTQAALQEFNVKLALVADEETAQGLCRCITAHMSLEAKRILFPRSSLPNPFLKEALTARGAIVTEIVVYENIKPAKRPLPSLDIGGIIFTSPSTVRNFLADYATIPAHWRVYAKGPVTLKALQQEGYHYATSLS